MWWYWYKVLFSIFGTCSISSKLTKNGKERETKVHINYALKVKYSRGHDNFKITHTYWFFFAFNFNLIAKIFSLFQEDCADCSGQQVVVFYKHKASLKAQLSWWLERIRHSKKSSSILHPALNSSSFWTSFSHKQLL